MRKWEGGVLQQWAWRIAKKARSAYLEFSYPQRTVRNPHPEAYSPEPVTRNPQREPRTPQRETRNPQLGF